jgi:aminopeptidase N
MRLFVLGLCLHLSLGLWAKNVSLGQLKQDRACYDVMHYDIQLRVDPQHKHIKGSNTMRITMQSNSKVLRIDLMSYMQVTGLQLDAVDYPFERKQDHLLLKFKQPLQKEEVHQIKILFSGYPKTALRAPWDGGFVWSEDDYHRAWVGMACEGIGPSSWLPCKDHWSDEAEQMDMHLEVPAALMGISNGRLVSTETLDSNWQRFNWHVASPINGYNISVNVGAYTHLSDTFYGQQKVDLDYYVLDYNSAIAERHFMQVDKMHQAFEKYFGPYPFAKDGYKLVETPYWGMEHQSCVAYGNHYKNNNFGFDFIIVHESGHEWFANSLTADDPADMWIHESFTTYSEALYVEHCMGKKTALEYLWSQRGQIKNQAPMQGPRGQYYHGSDNDIYYKGTWMLHTMRSMLNNDSLWFATLKQMNQKYFHHIVKTEDIIQFFNSNTGFNWDLFFNQYMYKSSLPELEIKQLLLDNGNIRYTLKLESDVKDLNIPLNIKLPNDQTITVVLSQKSVVIELDNRFDIYAYIEANYLLRIERE